MLIDSRILPADMVIETEVCIIGAGPAGITLAYEFLGDNFDVCLLESGGFKPNSDVQALCQGETVGNLFQDLHETRHRQFGGTANSWPVRLNGKQLGVRYVPLDPIDFEKRDWVPYSGWPFSKSHLDPFYKRAQKLYKIGDFAYDAHSWSNREVTPLPFHGDRVISSVFHFGSRSPFIDAHRKQISQGKNITVYVFANILELEMEEQANTVKRLRAASLKNNQFYVKAKFFILATGGVENARLLLLSNKKYLNGLGNQNDLVGRYFMDHQSISSFFIPSNRKVFNSTAFYDLRHLEQGMVAGKLGLSEATMRHERLLSTAVSLHPKPEGYQPQSYKSKKNSSKAVTSLKYLVSSNLKGSFSKNVFQHLGNIVVGLDDIFVASLRRIQKLQPTTSFHSTTIQWGWSKLKHKESKYAIFELIQMLEQAPDPENRITLSDQCDPFGQKKAKLHYSWGNLEFYSAKRTQEIIGEELSYSGLGKLISWIELTGSTEPQFHTAHHHIGTTRMHPDPKQGVVDTHCRVHGISNLYVAGSSVFPTGGSANPTLTILALSIRLADHLKKIINK